MRSALALGLRLALQSQGAGRLRTSLVAVAAALGVMILLSVLGLAHADVFGSPNRYVDRRSFTWLGVAVLVGIGLPVVVLAATVGRLSATMRDRRLASLRLLGLSPFRTRLVAITETGAAAAVGAAVGTAGFYLVRPLLAFVPVRGTTYPEALIRPWPIALAFVVIGVPILVAAVASLPARLDTASSLRRARLADARRPGWWRVVPLAVGAAWCAAFSRRVTQGPLDPTWTSINLIGSVLVLGIGMLLVLPVAVRLTGDLMLRLSRSPATLIAARRIQAQPVGVTRVISGLLIGLFLVTGARCVIVAFESTPQYIGAARGVEVQQQLGLRTDPPSAARLVDGLGRVEGVRAVITTTRLHTTGGCETNDPCLEAVVMSCGDVARIAPEVKGCRDRTALWLGTGAVPRGDAVEWTAGVDAASPPSARLAVPWTRAGGDLRSVYGVLEADVVLPPETPGLEKLRPEAVELVVLANPGRDLLEKVERAGLTTNAGWSGWSPEDYDFVQTLRGLVWSIALVILSLGLLSFAIAAIDRAVARRREVAALQVVGVPRSVLRKSQWIEAAIPISTGSLLAIGLGYAAGNTYLSLEPVGGFPWRLGVVLALIVIAGAVAVAGTTVLAATPRIRPDLIRSE